MTKVAPSMLSADFSRLGEELRRIEQAGADWAHIDVMDGVFVPNITIGPSVIGSIRHISEMPFDVHLMIRDPLRYVDAFTEAGADMLTVHAEAEGSIPETLRRIRDNGVAAGITLNPPTPIAELDRYLADVDLVLIMTVQAGFGGQQFKEDCLHKIEYVRRWADDHNPGLEISVDGGINRLTGRRAVEAGATVLAAGSSLFGAADMAAEIRLWKGFGPDPRV
ncbi:MAG: ribulose-phosphate 3-epimerase [Euryarchaeota archaeon]|jgi:ribulose-phosphate 3-epimerase|nr:ribulose-phosphate 3-epimerase [Euryarchaeota archaeon]